MHSPPVVMSRPFLAVLAFSLWSPAALGSSEIFASGDDAAAVYEAGPNTFSSLRQNDTLIRVGRQGTGASAHQAAVFPFQLPNLGAVAAPFSNAEFLFNLEGKEGVAAFNLDLYGLPSRATSAVLPAGSSTTDPGDFFMGTFLGGPANDAAPGVVKLHDNIATATTPDGTVRSKPEGSRQLTAWLNAQYNQGAGAGRWVFLRLSADAVPASTHRYIVSTANHATPANRPRLRYNFTPTPLTLYTRTGSDPSFQTLVDNGTIVPGERFSLNAVTGSAIDVHNAVLEENLTGPTGPIPQDIRIHTQTNGSVQRGNFSRFTRWYQEDGNVQVMRLFQGEQNVRDGIGADGTPGRIEAFFPPFTVAADTWSVWEGTYTIVEPLQSNIFQLFHEGGQLWAFHLRMNNSGTITFNRRNTIAGLPSTITIAENMVGRSLRIRVRANGRSYEVYRKIPYIDSDWVLVTTGVYTQAVNNQISFRWGMYHGSQPGQSIPKDGLLFVSGVSRTSEASSNDDPPSTPPPPVTYYWDNNGASAGFGSAGGVWGETTTGNSSQGWSTSSAGSVLPQDVSTNPGDPVFFGTSSNGLGGGSITVTDTVSCANLTFGAASGNITLNGGEIQMSGDRTITVGGGSHTIRSVLTGENSRTIAGTGTLTLAAANEFSGPLVIGDNSGGLRLRIHSIANADGTPSAAGAPTSSTHGIIQIGAVSNGSTLELSGSTAPQSTNRRIRIGSNGTGSGGATITNNNTDPAHTLTFTNAAFNVAATDTSSFNRTLTLRGSNTGDNIIQGAIIDNVGGSGGKVALAKSDAGTWVLTGANTYGNGTTIHAGTLRIGNGGSSGSLPATGSLTNHGILEFRRSNTLTQGTDFTSAAITGSGGLLQSGTGTTILNSAHSHQGLTTIQAGALRITHDGALGGTASGTVVNGTGTGSAIARLELAGGIRVVGEALTISGGGNFRGALTSQSGDNLWAGNITIAAPSTRIGAHEAAGGQPGATLRVSGVIDSGGEPHGILIRNGGTGLEGTVVLSAANTYLGETNLLIGRLQLDGGNNRLPVTTRLLMGNAGDRSEFDLNGRHQELAGLSLRGGVSAPGNNTVTNSSATPATLTLHSAAGAPSTFGGSLQGNLSLVKSGPDTFTLSGSHSHLGPTLVQAGTLALSGTSLTSPLSLSSSAALGFTLGSPASSTSSVHLGSGSIRITGSPDPAGTHSLLTAAGGITGTPLLQPPVPGHTLRIEDNGTRLVLSPLGAGASYAAWAATHAGGQGPELDFDLDGVPNGIEFFLNAPPGPTTLPALDATRSLTFPNGGNLPASAYGSRFVIQSSADLIQWTDVPAEQLADNTDGPGGILRLTLTQPGTAFVRLKVMAD